MFGCVLFGVAVGGVFAGVGWGVWVDEVYVSCLVDVEGWFVVFGFDEGLFGGDDGVVVYFVDFVA